MVKSGRSSSVSTDWKEAFGADFPVPPPTARPERAATLHYDPKDPDKTQKIFHFILLREKRRYEKNNLHLPNRRSCRKIACTLVTTASIAALITLLAYRHFQNLLFAVPHTSVRIYW